MNTDLKVDFKALAEWATEHPGAARALLEKTACVMPLELSFIIHGSNEAFYTGPREEVVLRVPSTLFRRLDKPKTLG